MPVADTKKVQTMINVAAQQLEIIRTADTADEIIQSSARATPRSSRSPRSR